MSLKERTPGTRNPLGSCTLPAGLSRSKSFGALRHKRSSSGAILRDPDNGKSTWTGGYVLGQAYNSPGGTRKYLGISPKAKIPKNPRPHRALDVAAAIDRGLRECVAVTEEDIGNLRTSVDSLSINSQQSQGKLYDLEKQVKSAERHLKKLEYQLSKLEELQEQYSLQQKLLDGVRSMTYAYMLSPGKEKESALTKVRSGYRECNDVLCTLEAQLELVMGTLLFQMKGIQGYARLCPGDVFEITVKHGSQKWKSRGRVNKDGQQAWDNPKAVFKGLLGEVLFIKAVEVKMLGKQVLLGNKLCEIRDLFSARPQLMTVNLNPSGSLKLNMVVTWNPIDSVDEIITLRPHPSGSPGSRRRSSPSPSTNLHNVSEIPSVVSVQGLSYTNEGLSPDHDSGQSSTSTVDSASPLSEYRNMINKGDSIYSKSLRHSMRTDSSDSIDRGSSDSHCDSPQGMEFSDPSGNFTLRKRMPDLLIANHESGSRNKRHSLNVNGCVEHAFERPHTVDFSYLLKENNAAVPEQMTRWSSWRDHDDMSLHDVIRRLESCLEDIQGQYPELHVLELHIAELEQLIRHGCSRRGSNGSDISLSIESALECFDFLDTENDEDIEYVDAEQNGDLKKTAMMDTDDHHHHSDMFPGQLMDEDHLSSRSHAFVTGSPQLDITLLTHLNYCQRLVENLGSFGPLRCREAHALEKLQKQAKIVGKILRHAKKDTTSVVNGFTELASHPHLQSLWDTVTEQSNCLCITADELVQGLEPQCRAVIRNTAPGLPMKVAKLLVQKLLDSDRFDSTAVVTVYQFQQFLRSPDLSFSKLVEEAVDEVNVVQAFHSNNTKVIIETLLNLSRILPPPGAMVTLTHCLLHSSAEVTRATILYLQEISHIPSLRSQIIEKMTETLESPNALDRQAACIALSTLQAYESIPQLAYLLQADEIAAVRNESKEALLSLGEEGHEAYQQSQLSSHGFQGLHVK